MKDTNFHKQQIEKAEQMVRVLNAENESDRIKSFIGFCASIGLPASKIATLLPKDNIFDVSNADDMSPELRRSHIRRINQG